MTQNLVKKKFSLKADGIDSFDLLNKWWITLVVQKRLNVVYYQTLSLQLQI